jgi:hypothetical protein
METDAKRTKYTKEPTKRTSKSDAATNRWYVDLDWVKIILALGAIIIAIVAVIMAGIFVFRRYL